MAKDSKGDEFVKQAEKRLKAWSPFSSSNKYEDAAELFQKAAAQYKASKEWDQAGDAYVKAAELCEKSKDGTSACSNYVEAAKVYSHSSPKDAVRIYKIAIQLHTDENRFSTAAKLWKDVATIEEKNLNAKDAIAAYTKAADCYEAENAASSANQMWIKVADLSAQEDDFKQAIQIYEKVAAVSAESQLGRHSVKDYLFKALLCRFVTEAKAGDVSTLSETIEKYKDRYPVFDGSRECKLIEGCVTAFKAEDVDKFTEIVFKYDQISRLDGWSSKVLLDIKTVMKEGAEGAAGEVDLR